MPTDDRLRFDKDQGRAPPPPSCCQTCPEESVRSGQLRPPEGALENVELVLQSQHLPLNGRTAAKAIPRRCQNGQHRWSWGEETETLNSHCIKQIGICEKDRSSAANSSPASHRGPVVMRGIELAEKIKKGQFKISNFADPRQQCRKSGGAT